MSDEYEKKYMHADEALFFERQTQKRLLLFPVLGVLAVVAGFTTALAQGPLLLTGLLAAAGVGVGAAVYLGGLAVFFGVARTAVTKEELRVEIGMLGPRLAMRAIKKAEVIPFTRRGRWGEPAFVPSTSTECVRVTFDKDGKERTMVLGTQRAAALVEAIERAKAPSLPRVRVEAPVDPDLAAAEAEVEAELRKQDAARAKSE